MNTLRKFNVPYSLKNIPYPTQFQYEKTYIFRAEQLIKKARWKLLCFKEGFKGKEFETFGFPTNNSPPQMPELKAFEEELIGLVQKLEFRRVRNPLQEQMLEDIRNLKESSDVVVSADKTGNLYCLPPTVYNHHLRNNITADYRKVDVAALNDINAEGAKIAKKLQLADRIEAIAEKPAYITIKDHKEDFPARMKFRLINSCKTNIGIISKKFLDDINKAVRASTGLQQWRCTEDVLHWFSNLPQQASRKFLKFDIESFYPSITSELLSRAINFARKHAEITEHQEDIIFHSCRGVLVGEDGSIWVKKQQEKFDVSMGSYDGGEVAELVGLYLLSEIEKVLPKGSFGLFRDDGLAALLGRGRQLDKMRKKLDELFRKEGLSITAETNVAVVDYLDVVLNLEEGSYKPFIKPNAATKYVSVNSNHPPAIIKNLPAAISRRLSSVSSSVQKFNEEVPHYQHALNQAGYSENLRYVEESEPRNIDERVPKKQRKRNVLWFNPPWAGNLKTNVGRLFLNLVKKHFPPSSPLHKLFNTKNMKIGYSCFPNFQSIINSHNKKVTNNARDLPLPRLCNCGVRGDECPLQGQCLRSEIVYKGIVSSREGEKEYVGQTKNTFKDRLAKHKNSFKYSEKRINSGLAGHVWSLKDRRMDYTVNYSLLHQSKMFRRGDRRCELCTTEKTCIAKQPPGELNKRSEVLNRCKHRDAHLLQNWIT